MVPSVWIELHVLPHKMPLCKSVLVVELGPSEYSGGLWILLLELGMQFFIDIQQYT